MYKQSISWQLHKLKVIILFCYLSLSLSLAPSLPSIPPTHPSLLVSLSLSLSHSLSFLLPNQVKEATETERVQRITLEKKQSVHEELLRKASQKEVGRTGKWRFTLNSGPVTAHMHWGSHLQISDVCAELYMLWIEEIPPFSFCRLYKTRKMKELGG